MIVNYLKILHLFYFIFAAIHILESYAYIDVDPSKSYVFGPGLDPQLVFPARYFIIQAVDSSGNNLTTSPDSIFTVDVAGIQERCRVWTQVLNRHDGSYIVRYRLYHTCSDLQIRILYNGKKVAKSPYQYKGPIHHEECFCPTKTLEEWLEQMSCPSNYQQMDKDLVPFEEIDMEDVVKEAKERFKHPGSYSLCHYAVIKNEVYRECIGDHVGFQMFPDAVLLSLTRKSKIPDVEFLINLGDWPLIKNSSYQKAIPVFSWCKSDDTLDIVMPTYDLTESTLESMGRVMLDMMTVQCVEPAWENKTQKAFWRGRDSRSERLDLINISRQNPHLLDAALTNFFFFREVESTYGPAVKHISFFDFFKFKYQVNIDGTVAAYRLPYLLAGNGVVFKQDSPYFEHFYNELTPMVHYIPFKRDLSNLIEQIQWAISHDDEAREIGQTGRKYAQENLMPRDIMCYNALLIKQFSKKLKKQPKKTEKMAHVPQPIDENNICRCSSPSIEKKEEL